LNRVIERIRPTPEERARLDCVARDLLIRIDDAAKAEGLDCQGILAGSAARGTWLSGDHDLDIFLSVPEDGDLGDALFLARRLFPKHEERYAEHAYVQAVADGIEVDLVPCFRLEDARRIRSAVDRTPFHSIYVSRRIAGLEDQVLLLKQFMKGVGVYGSELKTGGFSGYLAELLILRYGSFRGVLEAASDWRPGDVIDLEGHSRRDHDSPLAMIDPVDPGRNVAAALTLDRMFKFVAASRCFLEAPALDFFFPHRAEPLSEGDLLSHIHDRGTYMILVEFPAPAVVEDVLFPQLRKAEEAISALLARGGFSVMRSVVACHRDPAGSPVSSPACLPHGLGRILLELDIWELPFIRKHMGPPVWEEEHLRRFLASHQPISGPYIEGGRAVVEIPRRYTRARDLIDMEISNLALGKHISAQVRAGHVIYGGNELLQIGDSEFRALLTEFFRARDRIC